MMDRINSLKINNIEQIKKAEEIIKQCKRIERVLYCLETIDSETPGLIEEEDSITFKETIEYLDNKIIYIMIKCQITFELVQMNTDFSDCKMIILDEQYKYLENRDFGERSILYDYYTSQDLFPKESCTYNYDNIEKNFYIVLSEHSEFFADKYHSNDKISIACIDNNQNHIDYKSDDSDDTEEQIV